MNLIYLHAKVCDTPSITHTHTDYKYVRKRFLGQLLQEHTHSVPVAVPYVCVIPQNNNNDSCYHKFESLFVGNTVQEKCSSKYTVTVGHVQVMKLVVVAS